MWRCFRPQSGNSGAPDERDIAILGLEVTCLNPFVLEIRCSYSTSTPPPSVPGSEIVDDNQASEDVCVALRDAFDAAGSWKMTRASD